MKPTPGFPVVFLNIIFLSFSAFESGSHVVFVAVFLYIGIQQPEHLSSMFIFYWRERHGAAECIITVGVRG